MSGYRCVDESNHDVRRSLLHSGSLGLIGLLAGTSRGPGAESAAQKFDPDSSGQADKLLRNAAALARDRQWSEAINIYQRVIDQFGDKVAVVPRDETGAIARAISSCMSMSGGSAMRAIAHFRPRRARFIATGSTGSPDGGFGRERAQRDLGLLRRVVDQAFCSSWGDDALELLGDLAFQDGRFGEALAMYGRLVAGSAGRRQRAGSPRSLGRPGSDRRQETALPRGGRRESSRQGAARRVCPALSRGGRVRWRAGRGLTRDPG